MFGERYVWVDFEYGLPILASTVHLPAFLSYSSTYSIRGANFIIRCRIKLINHYLDDPPIKTKGAEGSWGGARTRNARSCSPDGTSISLIPIRPFAHDSSFRKSILSSSEDVDVSQATFTTIMGDQHITHHHHQAPANVSVLTICSVNVEPVLQIYWLILGASLLTNLYFLIQRMCPSTVQDSWWLHI